MSWLIINIVLERYQQQQNIRHQKLESHPFPLANSYQVLLYTNETMYILGEGMDWTVKWGKFGEVLPLKSLFSGISNTIILNKTSTFVLVCVEKQSEAFLFHFQPLALWDQHHSSNFKLCLRIGAYSTCGQHHFQLEYVVTSNLKSTVL